MSIDVACGFWEKSYPAGVSSDQPLPPATPVEHFLETAARAWPDAAAIDFYDRILTFAELHDLARRAAKGLQALSVGPGVNVGLHLLNTPHYVICTFAVLMAGGRVVNFSPLAAPRELKDQIEDTETGVMITLDRVSLFPQVAALAAAGHIDKIVVCALDDFLPPGHTAAIAGAAADRSSATERQIDFARLTANDGHFERHQRGPLDDEIALIGYTGGTTGEPKGAMLTHANFSAMVNIFLLWTGKADWQYVRKALVVLPLCHIFGFASIMLLGVATGAVMVLHTRFEINRVLADLSRKKITTFAGVPTMYSMLIGHSKIKEFDLSALRYCNVGGGPLPDDVLQRFRQLTGLTPLVGYGLTETTAMGAMQVVEGEPRVGTAGLPAPHTLIEIVDLDTGTKVLPVGECGEICCSGPHVMKGYWKRPEATEQAFSGGRFHTGDIGFLDADGYLTLVDRKKDMLICGGFNVFPRAIESVLCEYPTVAEAMVIGIPDPELGQTVKAFIELKPDCAALDVDNLKAFLADKIAPYEMPAQIEFRSRLPRTPVGKLSKRELVAQEAEKARLSRLMAGPA
jgi:long-chain acyl-CoA synthetase